MSPSSPVYENLVTIHIDLGKDFKHLVDQEMENELAVAQQKWGVSLNGDDSDRVLYHAKKQLLRGVSDNARSEWDGGRIVNVVAGAPRDGDIFLPDENLKSKTDRLLRKRVEWVVDEDGVDGSIPIHEFYEAYKQIIVKMARTAVFYGVGSYSSVMSAEYGAE